MKSLEFVVNFNFTKDLSQKYWNSLNIKESFVKDIVMWVKFGELFLNVSRSLFFIPSEMFSDNIFGFSLDGVFG